MRARSHCPHRRRSRRILPFLAVRDFGLFLACPPLFFVFLSYHAGLISEPPKQFFSFSETPKCLRNPQEKFHCLRNPQEKIRVPETPKKISFSADKY
jgi:hypothetical protein